MSTFRRSALFAFLALALLFFFYVASVADKSALELFGRSGMAPGAPVV